MTRRPRLVLIVGAFKVLPIAACSNPPDLEQRVAALESRLADSATYPLQFEERCAEGARKQALARGFGQNTLTTIESYFNPELRRCFVRIRGFSSGATIDWIFDAYTGRQYADKTDYVGSPGDRQCSVVLPDGRDEQCTSEPFEKLIAPYVGDAKLTR